MARLPQIAISHQRRLPFLLLSRKSQSQFGHVRTLIVRTVPNKRIADTAHATPSGIVPACCDATRAASDAAENSFCRLADEFVSAKVNVSLARKQASATSRSFRTACCSFTLSGATIRISPISSKRNFVAASAKPENRSGVSSLSSRNSGLVRWTIVLARSSTKTPPEKRCLFQSGFIVKF